MSQTITASFVESWFNILVGFTINFTANLLILPLFGFTNLTIWNNFIIGMIYTVISLVRSFVIRRWFNKMKWGNKAPDRPLTTGYQPKYTGEPVPPPPCGGSSVTRGDRQ